MLKNTTKSLSKLFISPRKGYQPRTAYVHGDGHILVIFERWTGRSHLEIVKVARLPDGVGCNFKGRIVCHNYSGVPMLRAALAVGLLQVTARVPSVESGSEATKKAGLAIGHIEFSTLVGGLTHYSYPHISTGFTYDDDQATIRETWEELEAADKWGGYEIVERIDLRAAPAAEKAEVL